jgi:hypothetical protein
VKHFVAQRRRWPCHEEKHRNTPTSRNGKRSISSRATKAAAFPRKGPNVAPGPPSTRWRRKAGRWIGPRQVDGPSRRAQGRADWRRCVGRTIAGEPIGSRQKGRRHAQAERRGRRQLEPGPTMTDREDRIRELAYSLWLEEGCPEGAAERHWLAAETRLESDPSRSEAQRRQAFGRAQEGFPSIRGRTRPKPIFRSDCSGSMAFAISA